MLFAWIRRGQGGLWRVSAEGGDPGQVTNGTFGFQRSLDGKRIFFQEWNNDNLWALSLEL